MGRRGESQKHVVCSQRRTFSWTPGGNKSKSCKNNGKADNIVLIDIDNDDNINNVITFNIAESLKQKLPGLTVLGKDRRCPIPIIICIHEEDEISDKNQPATCVEVGADSSSDASSSSRSPPPDETRVSTGGDNEEYQFLDEILSLLKLSKYKKTYCAKAPSRSRCGFGFDLDGDPPDKGQFDSDYIEGTLGESKAQGGKANKLKKDGSGEKVEVAKENKTGRHSKDQVHLHPGKISCKENTEPYLAGVEKSRCNHAFHNETPFATSDVKSTQETKGKQAATWKFSEDKERSRPDFSTRDSTVGGKEASFSRTQHSINAEVGNGNSSCSSFGGDEIRSHSTSADKENLLFEEPLFRNSKSKGETRVSDDFAGTDVEDGQPATSSARQKEEVRKENKTDKPSKDQVHLNPGKGSCKENSKSHFAGIEKPRCIPAFHNKAPANSDMKSIQETKGKQTARWVRVSRDKECPGPDFSHNEKFGNNEAGYVCKEASFSRMKHEVNAEVGNRSSSHGPLFRDGVRSHCCTSTDKENLVSEEPLFQNSKPKGERRVSDDFAGNNVGSSFGKCAGKYPPTSEVTEDPLTNCETEDLRRKSAGKDPLWGMADFKEGEEQCEEKVEQVPKKLPSGNKLSRNEAETELERVAQQDDKDGTLHYESGGEFVKCGHPTTSSARQKVELKKENKAGKLSKDGVHLNPGKASYKGNNKSYFGGREKSRCNPSFHNKTPFSNSDLKSSRETKGKQTARWVKISRDKETSGPDLFHNEATLGATFGNNNASYVCKEPSFLRTQHSVNGEVGNDSPRSRCCTSADQENLVSEEPSFRNSKPIGETRVRDGLSGNDVAGGDMNTAQDCLINIRERYKETDEYKRAEEKEWASRQHALRLQAEEAQKMRQVLKRVKAETLRKLEMERRQKERVEEIRKTQKKDEENMNMKEKLRAEVRMELEQLETKSLDMGSLLRGLGVYVSGSLEPQPHEIRSAYKKALLSFHPDRAPASDIRKLVEAEEKFKLISRLKEKLSPTL